MLRMILLRLVDAIPTVLLVLTLVFVALRILPGDPAQVALGREVYASLDCSSCHSIAGQGSPRSPLDGVGKALSRQEIHDWIVAADSVAEDLSPRAIRTKHAYRDLPPEKLEALVSYMQSLVD